MNKLSKFRPINITEKAIIQRSLSKVNPNLFTLLNKQYHIYICFNSIWKTQKFPSIFLISQEQKKFIQLFDDYRDIYSVGLYIGFIKKGKLLVSLEFLDFLKQLGILIKEKNVIVNEIGERAVLYGNDLNKEMVSQIPLGVKNGDEVIIVNSQYEILSIGKYITDNEDFSLIKPQDKVLVNIIDKGYYLRKKQ